jgi:rhomboid protease GluP
MNDNGPQLLETILKECNAAAPAPWYPSVHAQQTGTPREVLDPYLDQLRMGGLIQLTDWIQGKGQGYVLTDFGSQVLQNGRQLARLRTGEVRGPGVPARPTIDPGDIRPMGWERAEVARNAFLGHSRPIVTLALIALNVLWFVYGLAVASRENVPAHDYLFNTDLAVMQVLHQIGSLRGGDIYLNHEWWRLLTCCFVHIGFFHLAVNMYSLFVVGPLLERLWGSTGFLVLYLLAGLGGSCGMLIGNPLGGGAGASGAIWGVLASLAIWLFLNRSVLPRQLIVSMQRQLIVVFLLNIFITFGVAQISKGAHFGGGIVGLLVALPLDVLRFGRGKQWWAALAALVAIPIVCIAAAAISLNRVGGSVAEEERILTVAALQERVREVLKEARETLEPIVTNDPEGQSPEEVKKISVELTRERDELLRLKKTLDEVNVRDDVKLMQWREGLSRELSEFISLFEELEARLQRGEQLTEEDRMRLEHFVRVTDAIRKAQHNHE